MVRSSGCAHHSRCLGATIRGEFREADIWETVRLYYQSGQDSGLPEIEELSLNVFAKFGAYGEHFDEVAETFRKLEREEIDRDVFWDGFTYEFLRDLVSSHTETGQTKTVASLRVALDRGDFQGAEEWLGQLDRLTDEGNRLHRRYRRILDVGQQLMTDRAVELTWKVEH